MEKKNIIVIGASAGGVQGLKTMFATLSPTIDAAIFITWHMSAQVSGVLPKVLRKENSIAIANAIDREPIIFNRVYVAPPDRHLIIEKGLVRVTRGPKENRFRPAIDPMFRSAAYSYGSRVIGVILSGSLDDGASGLWTVKRFGGTAIVQDPEEAEFPSMPKSAMRNVEVDHKLSVNDIGILLDRLVKEDAVQAPEQSAEDREKTLKEIESVKMDEANGPNRFGVPTVYTCPECHGVLGMIREGSTVRYRCHTGHGFSADTLLSILSDNVENSIWNAVRGMEECIFLLSSLGDHYAGINQPMEAGKFLKKARQMEERARALRRAIKDGEKLSDENITGSHS